MISPPEQERAGPAQHRARQAEDAARPYTDDPDAAAAGTFIRELLGDEAR